jgi:Rieske [2Fe-2S] domain
MRVVVAPVSGFGDGERRIVYVGGRSIGVFRVGKRFYGIRNRCPHQGGPLCLGHVLVLEMMDGPGALMYASDYPHEHSDGLPALLDRLSSDQRDRMLYGTAAQTYGLAD